MSDYTVVIIWAIKIFFVSFICVFLPPCLNFFCFCWSLPFLYFIAFIFVWNTPLVYLMYLKRSLVFPFHSFPLFLCNVYLGRLSYLSLVFFGTLHSDDISFLFSFACCFFSQLFIRPLQTTILPFAFLFLGDGFDHHLLVNVTNLHPQFFRHSIRYNPLNLFMTSTV